MKKIKRILMALAICSLSIVAVGCSSNEKKNTTNNTNETKETKSEKLSNEEIVKKINEATKEIKSSKIQAENKMVMNLAGNKTETAINMNMETSSDPVVVKMSGSMNAMGQQVSLDMYFTEDAVYSKNVITKEWVKITDPSMRKTMEAQKNASNMDQMLSIMDSVQKNLKIEDKGSEYEISYSGNDESVKEALKEAIGKSQPNLKNYMQNVSIEKFDFFYKVDKSTFMPKEYSMKTVIKISQGEKEMSFDMDLKATLSDINKVAPITLPDEVKNAKEMKTNQ